MEIYCCGVECPSMLSDLWSRVRLHPITNHQMSVSEQQHSLYKGSVKAHNRKHIHKHTAIQHMAWDSTCKHAQALPCRRWYTNIHPSKHGETKTSSNGVEWDCWIWWLTAESWHASHQALQRISQAVYKGSYNHRCCAWNCILWPKSIQYTNLEDNKSG